MRSEAHMFRTFVYTAIALTALLSAPVLAGSDASSSSQRAGGPPARRSKDGALTPEQQQRLRRRIAETLRVVKEGADKSRAMREGTQRRLLADQERTLASENAAMRGQIARRRAGGGDAADDRV